MKEISAFNIARLSHEEALEFFDHTQHNFQYLPQNSSEPDLPEVHSVLRALSLKSARLQKVVDKFNEAVAAFDAVVKLARKNPLTEKLLAADEDRDKAWTSSNAYINAMVNHPDPEVAAVAKIARDLFDKNGNPTQLAQTKESGTLHNLLQDIEAMESRETIDFDPWYNWMKTTHEAFQALLHERSHADGAKTKGQSRETRDAAEDAYRELVKVINSLVVAEETDEYDEFIDTMNAEIDRLSALIKSRETRRENQGSTTPKPEPSDDDKPTTEEPEEPSTEEPDTPTTEEPGTTEEPDDRPVVQ